MAPPLLRRDDAHCVWAPVPRHAPCSAPVVPSSGRSRSACGRDILVPLLWWGRGGPERLSAFSRLRAKPSQSLSCQSLSAPTPHAAPPPSAVGSDGKNRWGRVSNNKTDEEICARKQGRAPSPALAPSFPAFWHTSFPLISSLILLEPSSLVKSLRRGLYFPLVLSLDGAHGPRRSEHAGILRTAAEVWRS